MDITDLFLSDSDLFALKGAKESLKLGGYQQGQSYALDVKAFPENINFRSIRSYGLAGEVKRANFLPRFGKSGLRGICCRKNRWYRECLTSGSGILPLRWTGW